MAPLQSRFSGDDPVAPVAHDAIPHGTSLAPVILRIFLSSNQLPLWPVLRFPTFSADSFFLLPASRPPHTRRTAGWPGVWIETLRWPVSVVLHCETKLEGSLWNDRRHGCPRNRRGRL